MHLMRAHREMCSSVLQRVAACCSVLQLTMREGRKDAHDAHAQNRCFAECCRVLRCVAAWCSVLLCVRMMRMHTPEQPHLDTTYYILEEPHLFKNDYTFKLLTTPVDKMHHSQPQHLTPSPFPSTHSPPLASPPLHPTLCALNTVPHAYSNGQQQQLRWATSALHQV